MTIVDPEPQTGQQARCAICSQISHATSEHPLTPRVAHQCQFSWCTTEWDYKDSSPDHYQGMTYVIPTTYPGKCPAVGAGLVFDEGEQAAPWISVHLDGGNMDKSSREVDEDTHLTIDEAIELRDLLDVAISHGLGYEPVVSKPDPVILVEQNSDGADRCEIVCLPFEPDAPGYKGELYLGMYWDGQEESFAVIKPEHANHLAALLKGASG